MKRNASARIRRIVSHGSHEYSARIRAEKFVDLKLKTSSSEQR
jgi:hypothetical protein